MPPSSVRRLVLALIALACSLVAPLAGSAAGQHRGFSGEITVFDPRFGPPTVQRQSTGGTALTHMALFTIARAWEARHPGVLIRFVDVPRQLTDYYMSLKTRLAAGAAPDIFELPAVYGVSGPATQFVQKGLILDLTRYLRAPNPYLSSNMPWNDSFVPWWKVLGRTADGIYAVVPIGMSTTTIYYNATVAHQLGLHLPPHTWAEFMRDLAATQRAGNLAIASFNVTCGKGCPYYWLAVAPQFLWNLIPKFATLRYHPRYIPGIVTSEEWARAILHLGWQPRRDKGFIAAMRLYKSWLTYFAPGWSHPDDSAIAQRFTSGRLIFDWTNTEFAAYLHNDKRLSFKVGTFWLPPVTRDSSPFAPSPPVQPPGIGTFSDGYAINASLAGSPKLDLAVDFLRFLTTPANDARIVNEHAEALPSVVGAHQPAAIRGQFASLAPLKKTYGVLPISLLAALSTDDQGEFYSDVAKYAWGLSSEASLLQQMDALFLRSAKTLYAQNARTWDRSKW